jgi:hypothetical protein
VELDTAALHAHFCGLDRLAFKIVELVIGGNNRKSTISSDCDALFSACIRFENHHLLIWRLAILNEGHQHIHRHAMNINIKINSFILDHH